MKIVVCKNAENTGRLLKIVFRYKKDAKDKELPPVA